MDRDLLQRVVIAAGVIIGAVLCLLPSVIRDDFFSQKWFTRPLALGLDISGGVHLVYSVQAHEAVKSRLQSTLNGVRTELRAQKIAVTQSQVTPANAVELTLLTDSFVEQAKRLVEEKFKDLVFETQTVEAGRPKLTYSMPPKLIAETEMQAVEQAVETLRNRVDQYGVAEPLIQRAGERRIILQMPGVSDVESVKKMVGKVARLEFRMVADATTAAGVGKLQLKDQRGAPVTVEDQALMTGDAVADARVGIDAAGKVEVELVLSTAGAKTFGRITTENVRRDMAIILDNVVYSAPRINEPITGGTASISGGFSTEEARQLKIVLKAGALPASLKVEEERYVGPTLGKESIKKGILAMVVGVIAIIFFMVIYYKKSGAVAAFTLILNAVLLIAALSLFGATLTLPGLAGLALTIGMAVDSSVIIFERIRDELRAGVSRDLAVHAGFDKALTAIIDANVTTLLTGAVLYYFGTGPIRGFAVTLCVGVVTTLYCAVILSRLCFDYFHLKGRSGLSI
jgi:preprotein translocase subunit SecD